MPAFAAGRFDLRCRDRAGDACKVLSNLKSVFELQHQISFRSKRPLLPKKAAFAAGFTLNGLIRMVVNFASETVRRAAAVG